MNQHDIDRIANALWVLSIYDDELKNIVYNEVREADAEEFISVLYKLISYFEK